METSVLAFLCIAAFAAGFVDAVVVGGGLIPMAVCNAAGGFLGAKLAISKGNKFIRIFFLVIVIGTLARFAYDIFQSGV